MNQSIYVFFEFALKQRAISKDSSSGTRYGLQLQKIYLYFTSRLDIDNNCQCNFIWIRINKFLINETNGTIKIATPFYLSIGLSLYLKNKNYGTIVSV